jgi:hypothetical protein
MQYVMLSDKFGGLNEYLNPDKIGPANAQEMVGVDVSTGALTAAFESGLSPTAQSFISKTIFSFNNTSQLYSGRYSIAIFGGLIYRSHRGFNWPQSYLPRAIQYSSDGTVWDVLTMAAPAKPTLAVTGSGGSISPGSYTYVLTFVNDLGYESGPSPSESATVTATNSRITVTLPTVMTTGTLQSGSNTVTSVANGDIIRVGMRLVSKVNEIPPDTYVTFGPGVGSTTFEMSNPAGPAAGSGKEISDAQIKKINIYRRGGGTTEYLLVATVNFGTSSFSDTLANTALGVKLLTEANRQLPFSVKNVTINPSGTLFCDDMSQIIYFSLSNIAGANPGLYNPEQTIKSPGRIMASIYALDRFFFFTDERNFSVFLDNALDGFPVLKFIENSEPCDISNFVYPVEMNSSVFWNTSNGIMRTDGNSINSFTKYTFSKEQNRAFKECYGGFSVNDTLYFYSKEKTDLPFTTTPSYRWIYKYTEQNGWSRVFKIPRPATPAPNTYVGDGGLGFLSGTSGATCSYGPDPEVPGDTTIVLKFIESGLTRPGPGTYWTGEWVGDKHSSLKKFRKISALFTGSIEIEVYVDGNALPNKLSEDNGAATKRISWWLPPEIKGRAISLKVELKTGAFPPAVEELGVWVGEQRREMP